MPAADPSPFFRGHAAALAATAPLGPVLDLACGVGRHALAAGDLGLACVAMDRDPAALGSLRAERHLRGSGAPPLLPVRTDLETSRGIPVATGSCGAVLVFRFLYRPLAPEIERVLAPGGLLLYETFTILQKDVPHGPGNTDFLILEGELPTLFRGLELLEARERTEMRDGRPWHLAALAGRKPRATGSSRSRRAERETSPGRREGLGA